MPIQVKTVLEPPEWFDTGNYKYTDDFEDWFYNIALRSSVVNELIFIRVTDTDNISNNRAYDIDIIDEGILSDNNKICLLNYPDLFDEINNCRLNSFLTSKAISYFKTINNIRPLTLHDVLGLGSCIPESLNNAIKRRDEQPVLGGDEYIKPLSEQENEDLKMLYSCVDQYTSEIPFLPSKKLHVKIDINAPLDLLVNEFKHWAIEQKGIHYKRPLSRDKLEKWNKYNLKDTDYKKIPEWKKYQILPYLDLLIWQLEEGIELQHSVLGEWLFPKYVNNTNTTQMFRRNTKLISKFLINPQFISYWEEKEGYSL